jgi:Bacterial regulatory proteins, gntR family
MQIAAHIREHLADGSLTPGNPIPTINDLRRQRTAHPREGRPAVPDQTPATGRSDRNAEQFKASPKAVDGPTVRARIGWPHLRTEIFSWSYSTGGSRCPQAISSLD